MQQNLSDWLLSECYKHAEECRSRGTVVQDGPLRSYFFDMEQQWLKMAEKIKCELLLQGTAAAGKMPHSDARTEKVRSES
jgi:hypothetical protein